MASYVNEFLEDFTKLVVKTIDRDPALIKIFLHEPSNVSSPPDGYDALWDATGLIPIVFTRIQSHIPQRYFMYNSVLDLIRQVSVQSEAKDFIETEGSLCLQSIYEAKKELPQLYMED